mmetsp:Transcript_20293/g.28522  ORF Transcript_20293/g.28522 Transcript_20293/m.28522 type:complete len:161 (+) Transcript_20293:2535-3017(+)
MSQITAKHHFLLKVPTLVQHQTPSRALSKPLKKRYLPFTDEGRLEPSTRESIPNVTPPVSSNCRVRELAKVKETETARKDSPSSSEEVPITTSRADDVEGRTGIKANSVIAGSIKAYFPEREDGGWPSVEEDSRGDNIIQCASKGKIATEDLIMLFLLHC